MSLKYFVTNELIPEDSSKEKIEEFYAEINKLDKDSDLLIFPDVHYKRLAPIPNGLLLLSKNRVYPSFLGVPNCGFTFGKMSNIGNEDSLRIGVEKLTKEILAYNLEGINLYKKKEIFECFEKEIEKEFLENKDTFLRFGISKEELLEVLKNDKIMKIAMQSLSTMGGGNHFFEVHKVVKTRIKEIEDKDYILILHSDSVGVGAYLEVIFSNSYMYGIKDKLKNRIKQILFFKNKLIKDKNFIINMFSKNHYRSIPKDSFFFKEVFKYFTIGQIFGKVNREIIINKYINILSKLENNLRYNELGTHSHDFVKLINLEDKNYIMHANGVQYIGNDKYYILPGALGTSSFIMKNTFNKEAYFSANHGVGRFKDKHLAKKEYEKIDVEKESKIEVFKIGNGKLEEQFYKAFKNVNAVIDEMEKNNLGENVVEIKPMFSMKG